MSFFFGIWNGACSKIILGPLFYLFVVLPHCYKTGNKELMSAAQEPYLRELPAIICPHWFVGFLFPGYMVYEGLTSGETRSIIGACVLMIFAFILPIGGYTFIYTVAWLELIKGDPGVNPINDQGVTNEEDIEMAVSPIPQFASPATVAPVVPTAFAVPAMNVCHLVPMGHRLVQLWRTAMLWIIAKALLLELKRRLALIL